MNIKNCMLFAGIIAAFSCKSSFTAPEGSSPDNGYLVVEGYIVTGSTDSTIIKLSRTVKLSGKTTTAAEAGNQVFVQDEAGKSYALADKGKGIYAAPPLGLPSTGKYRLQIRRGVGRNYQSDYVQAKTSPPIDSVNFETPADGLHVYVNTHDDTKATRYYRWQYRENWEFTADYNSSLRWDNTIRKIVPRTAAENIYNCYQSHPSNDIILNSTLKLSNDVVSKQLLSFTPSDDEKVSYRYSVLVSQYALTEEAFNFWQLLKKNTEQLGSIFDAQPSQLTGNVHNTADASEPVIGYISAGTISKKRIYFLRYNYDLLWRKAKFAECYKVDTIGASSADYFNQGFIPIDRFVEDIEFAGTTIPVEKAIVVQRRCADCTLRGSTVKPSFWPF